MTFSTLEKTWFLGSLVLLVFLYGVAVGQWKWPPHATINGAIEQGRRMSILSLDPHFVHPRPYDRQGTRTFQPDHMQEGVTLLSTNWKSFDWGAGLKLIDEQGRSLHEWRVSPAELSPDSVDIWSQQQFSAPHALHLFDNGDVLVEVRGPGRSLVRLDACGSVQWRLPDTNGKWEPHHSISRAEDGTFWVSGRRQTNPPVPELQHLEEISEDLILHISPSGTVLDKTSVPKLLWENDLERFVFKQFEHEAKSSDLTHLNDIEPLPDSLAGEYPLFDSGDLVVSLRRPDLVLVFDPDTRNVKWHTSGPFINQHDPDFIGDGWIGIFDNNQDFSGRGTVLGGSRIVAVQPHTDSVEVRFPTAQSPPFYTPFAGEWQQLSNGNMLLTETKAGRVVEVAPNGEQVWEWVNAPYSENEIAEVFEARRYPLTREQIASWDCSSANSARD